MSLPANNTAVASTQVQVSENQYERFRMQKDLGVALITNIKKVLKTEGINFTEDLSNSFELVMNIKSGTSAVETSNPYANLVDKGMKPGVSVNFDALYDWVRIKIGLEEPELTDVTWKILHKIRNKGIDPTHFAKKAIKKVIGKHGLAGTHRRKYKKKTTISGQLADKRGRFAKMISKVKANVSKSAKKINKVLKKVRKNVTKTSNLRKINRGLRQINKYGSKSVDTMRKYK
jgi:hypothetical protein|tara:strand:+ start:40 stop:735 length:696 start_codon:yes stop_codon:yes gene_type:complete